MNNLEIIKHFFMCSLINVMYLVLIVSLILCISFSPVNLVAVLELFIMSHDLYQQMDFILLSCCCFVGDYIFNPFLKFFSVCYPPDQLYNFLHYLVFPLYLWIFMSEEKGILHSCFMK